MVVCFWADEKMDRESKAIAGLAGLSGKNVAYPFFCLNYV